VLKAFINNMSGRSRPEITFGETVNITDNRIEIPSTVVLDGNTFNVLYRLGRLKSGWEIYDIVAENISVVSNYRQQLDDHFRKGTGAELISKLEELLQKDDIGNEIKI
jgi:ABC-type transport system involved in resistance to organic solvents, auxiliary component